MLVPGKGNTKAGIRYSLTQQAFADKAGFNPFARTEVSNRCIEYKEESPIFHHLS